MNSLEMTFWQRWLKYGGVYIFIIAALYGSTYQQFRHFDITDSRGASDAVGYVRMSYGEHSNGHKQFRIIVPRLAAAIRLVIVKIVPEITNYAPIDSLSFYIVNFFFSSLTAFIFFLFLQNLGFPFFLMLLGVYMFCASRLVVLATGTPLVDSVFYLAVALLAFCIQRKNSILLVVFFPFMLLCREAMLIYVGVVICEKAFRKWYVFFAIVLGFILYNIIRWQIGFSQESINEGVVTDPIVQSLVFFSSFVFINLKRYLTLSGWHNLLCGFGLFIIFAIIGGMSHLKEKKYEIANSLWLFIPISLAFTLLSSNFGRMFFPTFVVVIPLVLIGVEWLYNQYWCEVK